MDCSLPGYSVHGILQARILVSNFHGLIAYLFLLLNNILCWSWNSNTLATWCEELTHLKRPWCWERLRAGGEGDDRDVWLAPTQWTWVWVDSGSWWWTGRPGVLQFMGSQRVGHDWATELKWIFSCVDVPWCVYSSPIGGHLGCF